MNKLLVATLMAGTLMAASGSSAQASPDIPACVRTATELVVAARETAKVNPAAGFPHVTEARHSFTRCATSVIDDLDRILTAASRAGLHEPAVEVARDVLVTAETEGDRRQFFLELVLCHDLDLCD